MPEAARPHPAAHTAVAVAPPADSQNPDTDIYTLTLGSGAFVAAGTADELRRIAWGILDGLLAADGVEDKVLAAVRAALSADGITVDGTPAARTVVIPTWEWDNGWFFYLGGATVTFDDGSTELREFSDDDDNDDFEQLVGRLNPGFLGKDSGMVIDLVAGSVSVEEYLP